MLIYAKVPATHDSSIYRDVQVEAPDPYVVAQSGMVRIVATYAHHAGPEFTTFKLEDVQPRLVVEYCVGEDAMGVERWEPIMATGRTERALNAVARMLFERTRHVKPTELRVVEPCASKS